MSHDVFLSYSTKDKVIADAICATLEGRAIRCWMAPRDIMPGQDWSEAIIDALSSAKIFVLLLSSSSNISEQVKREVQNAVTEGLSIVPFRLEDVHLSKHMRYFIGTPHWLDALTPPLEAHLERLVEIVRALLQCSSQEQVDDVMYGEPKTLVSSPVPTAEALIEPQITPKKFGIEWNPEELRKIELELAAFVGPMARVLVHKTAPNVVNLGELCDEVSRYVPTPEERSRFLLATQRYGGSAIDLPIVSDVPPVTAPPPPPEVTWEPAVLQQVESHFARYIGPMARIMVKKASANAANIDELYSRLAESIPTVKEKAEFLKTRTRIK